MLKDKQLLLLWFSALSIFYLDILSSEFFSFSPAECRRPVGLALPASHLWGDPSRSLSFSVPSARFQTAAFPLAATARAMAPANTALWILL